MSTNDDLSPSTYLWFFMLFMCVKIVYAFQIYMCSVWKLNKLISYYFYTYIFDFILYFSCLNGCVGRSLCSRLWAWNGLPLNTYISLYASTNRCCNERVSRTNYIHSGIPHFIIDWFAMEPIHRGYMLHFLAVASLQPSVADHLQSVESLLWNLILLFFHVSSS